MNHQETNSFEWAFETFGPLLYEISFETMNEDFKMWIYKPADYLKSLNKINCKLFIQKDKLSDGNLGLTQFASFEDKESFRINISLDEMLFKTEHTKLRKAIGTHEVVHCIASLIKIPDLKHSTDKKDFQSDFFDKVLIDLVTKEMVGTIDNINKSNDDIGKDDTFPAALCFDDEHYRLDDRFKGRYNRLFENLLFSTKQFESFFTKDELNEIKSSVKSNVSKAVRCALSKADDMVRIHSLYRDTVIRRIGQILKKYLEEHFKV